MARRTSKAKPDQVATSSHLAGDRRPARAPSFGICEGVREELERTGKSIDPFTGEVHTKEDA